MSTTALALVVTAAAAHAAWNVQAKRAGGGVVFVALALVVSAIAYVPVLGVSVGSGAEVDAKVIGLGAVGALLHGVYFVILQRAYRIGDLSLVYPLARGTGPLLAGLAGVLALGERPSLVGALGAATVTASILALAATAKGTNASAPGMGWALFTGALIACYTLWDANAVRHAGASPFAYYAVVCIGEAALFVPVLLRRASEARATWARARRQVLAVAALSPLAYTLVLLALQLAPVVYVAPGRELSIVFGIVAGRVLLGEDVRPGRIVAAGGIVLGIIALAAA